MYLLIGLAIVIGSSIWVFNDAKKIGVTKGQLPGIADLSPGGWLVACLGLWIISFPTYILKRGALLKANQKGSDSTAVTIGGLAVVAMFVVLSVMGLQQAKHSMLEASAQEVVTNIVHGNGGSASCIRVKITEKVSDSAYRATATLSNGNDLPVIITDEGERIHVSIAR